MFVWFYSFTFLKYTFSNNSMIFIRHSSVIYVNNLQIILDKLILSRSHEWRTCTVVTPPHCRFTVFHRVECSICRMIALWFTLSNWMIIQILVSGIIDRLSFSFWMRFFEFEHIFMERKSGSGSLFLNYTDKSFESW